MRSEVIDFHFDHYELKNKGKNHFFHSNPIIISLGLFSFNLLPQKWCSDIYTYIQPPFWTPFDNDRFFGIPNSFWYPFLTSDDPEDLDLQISMTSGGKNIKSMKMDHVRYRITGFWCSKSILRPLFNLRWSWRSWPPYINDLRRSKYEINEKSHVRYQITGFGCSDSVLRHLFNLKSS